MKTHVGLGLIALAVLLTGCPHNEYVVELQPDGATVTRRLTCWRVEDDKEGAKPGEFPAAELARLKASYPDYRFDPDKQRHEFKGQFTNALPQDVGGAGQYRHWTTTLGTVSTYLERFRGLDDLQERLDQRMKAMDQVVDVVLEWLKAEVGREKGFPKLRQSVNEQVRRDLKNFSLYCWQAEMAVSEESGQEEILAVRLAQYFFERGYFQPEDEPVLWNGLFNDDGQAGLQLWRTWVVAQLGLPRPGPWPKALAFLDDIETLKQSWDRALARSSWYRRYLEQWQKKPGAKAATAEPSPHDAFSELAGEATGVRLELGGGGSDDQVSVKLVLPAPPERTNGEWDEATRTVSWRHEIEAEHPVRLPGMCYALWNLPAADFQQARFGKVPLQGPRLTRYVFWRASLAPEQGAAWDRFVGGLKPGDDLDQRWEAFQSSAPTWKAKASEAETAFKLLKEGR